MNAPHVYSRKSSTREEVDSKIKMCLETFNILDGILREFILIVYEKL